MQAGAPGRYLSFRLATEVYAVPIQTVSEIIGLSDITPVPNTAPFVRGVLNLRGSIIPVIDLRGKFGMPPIEAGKETCIIVMDVEDRKVGAIVDNVNEVVDFTAADIEPTPHLGDPERLRFVGGLGKLEGCVSILIDVARAVSREELALAGRAA